MICGMRWSGTGGCVPPVDDGSFTFESSERVVIDYYDRVRQARRVPKNLACVNRLSDRQMGHEKIANGTETPEEDDFDSLRAVMNVPSAASRSHPPPESLF